MSDETIAALEDLMEYHALAALESAGFDLYRAGIANPSTLQDMRENATKILKEPQS